MVDHTTHGQRLHQVSVFIAHQLGDSLVVAIDSGIGLAVALPLSDHDCAAIGDESVFLDDCQAYGAGEFI